MSGLRFHYARMLKNYAIRSLLFNQLKVLSASNSNSGIIFSAFSIFLLTPYYE